MRCCLRKTKKKEKGRDRIEREGKGKERKKEKTDFTQNDLREVTLDTKKLSKLQNK